MPPFFRAAAATRIRIFLDFSLTFSFGVCLCISLFFFLFSSDVSLAQTAAAKNTPTSNKSATQASSYFSQIDTDLTIRKVAIFPVTDNLDGIYARPIESHLKALVKEYHQWDLVEANFSDALTSVGDLEESPDDVKRLGQNIDADAFIVAKASKGPTGLTIKVNLFLRRDGKLLAQEALKDHPRFELSDLKSQMQTLFAKLKRKIPYDGLVLSRQGNRVTVNLGKADGVVVDQVLTVVQLIKAVRHPKFNFLVSTEKEILGKIKVLKVDDMLSFGAMLSELDKGVVRRFHKVAGLDQVTYPEPEDLESTVIGGESVLDRPEAEMTFGKNPEEWRPNRPPAFGSVSLKVGIGSYTSSVSMTSENLEAASSFAPSLGIAGELWLNPHWLVRVELEQSVVQTKNPRSGSTPSELNHSGSRYALMGGYNVLLQDDFFGPKLQIRAGLMNRRVFVDNSTPVALTTTTYSGYIVGLFGSLPITEKRDWYLGAGLNMALFPELQEKPVTSGGSAKNSINDFALWVEKKLNENLRATASLDFSLYSTTFSGSGTRVGEVATSLSQKQTSLGAGIIYMF